VTAGERAESPAVARPVASRFGAVWFDLFGTLVDLGPLGEACEAVAPGRGTVLAERWRARQLEATWLRTVMGAWADFEAVTADALKVATADLELAWPADPVALERLASAFERLPARPEARPLLDRLRAGDVRIGVLSNGSTGMIERTLAAAGLADAIDLVRSVDEVERYKPHPSVYRLAIEASPASAPIGFVTANGWDAAGASVAGLTVAWLRPNPAAVLPAVGGPSLRVATWAELPAVFGIDRG
jgi:2-haloacid dehalogenase